MDDLIPGAFELTCNWLPDDRCTSAAIGMAAHPTDGVIPICKWHADMFRVPLIKPRGEVR